MRRANYHKGMKIRLVSCGRKSRMKERVSEEGVKKRKKKGAKGQSKGNLKELLSLSEVYRVRYRVQKGLRSS